MNWPRWTSIKDRERELDEEVEADFVLEVQERMRYGATREEAEFGARRAFGNVTRVKEVTREMWGWGSIERVGQDVRFGVRSIRKDWPFFLTALLTLALGIGCAAAIFSLVYNVLLHPFPYRDGQHLFCPEVYVLGTSRMNNMMTVPEFLDFQHENLVFVDSMGVTEETVLLNESGKQKELDADRVTGNAFQFLGVSALFGRGLLPRDAEPGAPPVFVLNYRLWKRDFNSDPNIIGKIFDLDGTRTTLVGIMPPRFAFWDGNLWRPLLLDRANKERPTITMYGHLRPGLNPKEAAAEWMRLATRLAKVYPSQFPKHFKVVFATLIDETVHESKPTIYALLSAAGLLLLITCVNVSNLQLARATAREKELAIRVSLGSGRTRVIRQLMVESVLLALAGAAGGYGLAWAALWGLVEFVPMWTFPDEAVMAENKLLLLSTIGLALLAGIFSGLAPALTASHRDVNGILKVGTDPWEYCLRP